MGIEKQHRKKYSFHYLTKLIFHNFLPVTFKYHGQCIPLFRHRLVQEKSFPLKKRSWITFPLSCSMTREVIQLDMIILVLLKWVSYGFLSFSASLFKSKIWPETPKYLIIIRATTSSNLIRVTNNRTSVSESVFPHIYLCLPSISSHLSRASNNFFTAWKKKEATNQKDSLKSTITRLMIWVN